MLISFLMIPMYYTDNLLKSQLLNLEHQTNKNFDVIILDPHYNKRKDIILNILDTVSYKYIYAQYYQNLNTAKYFDYSMWNTASLLSSSRFLCFFQDYRYCNKNFVSIIEENRDNDYIKFDWHVCSNEDIKNTPGTSYIDFSDNEIINLKYNGIFPDIQTSNSITHHQNWGHYVISRNMWIELNGVDEHITTLRHHGDLDLNARISNYFHIFNKKQQILTIKNMMVKMMHSRKSIQDYSNITTFKNGFRTIEFDIPNPKLCEYCEKIHNHAEIKFYPYIMDLVDKKIYNEIYRIPLKDSFKNTKNKKIDVDYVNDLICSQCTICNMTSETNVWWERIDSNKYKASIGIGCDIKVGRNLQRIYDDIKNLETSEKIEVLKNSWNEPKYHEI